MARSSPAASPKVMDRKASVALLNAGAQQSVDMLLRTKPVGRIKKILKTKGIPHGDCTTKTELIHLLKKHVTAAESNPKPFTQ